MRRVLLTVLLATGTWSGSARAHAIGAVLDSLMDTRARVAVLDSLMDTRDIPRPLVARFAEAYAENWVLFGSGLHQNYFFLPQTVRATPSGTTTVWSVNLQDSDPANWLSSREALIGQRRDSHADTTQYARYLLTRIEWEIDCEGQRVRALRLIDVDEDNSVIWSGRLPGRLETPAPDSNAEGLLHAFCHTAGRTTFRDIVNTPMGEPVAGH